MKRILLLSILVLLAIGIQAEELTIKGKVINQDGEAIPSTIISVDDWLFDLTPELVFHDPEEDYRPLAKEGKVWNYQRILYNNPRTYQNYSYIIKGDTTINEKDYKKLYYRSSRFETYAGALRDEKGKAYYVQLDSINEKLYYDMTIQGGDRIINPNTVYEYDSNTAFQIAENNIVEVNGTPVRHVIWNWIDLIGGVTTNAYSHWYEGIGTMEDKFLPKKFQQSVHELLSCIEDGVFIYGNKNSVPPNHYRRPIRFDYEAKDGLNHPKSKIWAENDNTSTGIYFENVTDSFKIYVNNNYFDAFGSAFIGSTFIEWGGTFARFPITITIESEYEKFSGQITERYEETDYRPFIEEGKVWKVGRTYGTAYSAYQLTYCYFEGDTIIDGRECKKMRWRHEKKDSEPWTEYVGALYEDTRRVYLILPGTTELKLIYDFASSEGQSLDLYNHANAHLIETVEATMKKRFTQANDRFKGECYTVSIKQPSEIDEFGNWIYSDNISIEETWMEGVGSQHLPLDNCSLVPGYYECLMLCTVGDEVLYYNPNIIDGVTPDDGAEVKKNTIDFTHVVKTKPKAPRRGAVSENGDDEPLTASTRLRSCL